MPSVANESVSIRVNPRLNFFVPFRGLKNPVNPVQKISAVFALSAVKIRRIFSLFFAFFLTFSHFFSIFPLPIPPKLPKPTHQPSFLTQKTTSHFKINPKFPPFFKNPDNFSFELQALLLTTYRFYCLSFCSLYSTESTSACHEASMMFSETPTVPQIESLSRDSIITRTRAAVPARAFTTRTL